MNIITRNEAIKKGLSRYFTGKPCKHGHVAERVTLKSTCLECKKLEYLTHSERYKAANRAWKLANPELSARLDREAHLRIRNDPVRHAAKLAKGREYVKANKTKVRALSVAWDIANPQKRTAYAKHHKAMRKRIIGGQAISKRYSREIREIYFNCPVGHDVDHIVPLRGKTVTGLHVPWNLQYLPTLDNIKKGNKFETL